MDQGKAFVVGRLSRDPDFFGEGDKQRAVFSVAYNRGTGDRRKSNFLDCIAWGKRADIMRDFSKGSGIFITGDIEHDSYENKEGVRVNRVQINVSSITATTSLRRGDESNGKPGEVRVGGTAEETADIPF
ncbi:MAG: single-stranded DNA-binding protein [Candidatus Thorarchaeota archaeon]|jgi:single-strand DNA-binding protein